ncbi:TPA: anaerobic sulfatase maturase [Mannheimia haemolytica]|uniref:anaerobic sulfatase maturase n=1 Tax=Mannheimia haemolytica TaxID=75985 RepID=UPI0039FCF976
MTTTYFHLMAKPSSFHCNIQCEYCFYLSKEQTIPPEKSQFMNDETLQNYIRHYIEANQSQRVDFVWQGGEPTLLGLDFYKQAVKYQQKFANGKQITNAIQSNGIALNRQWASFFKENHFLVGLSIDGLSDIHDRYRISTNGKPTFERVKSAVDLLKEVGVEFNTLTVVNDRNWQRGRETYQALKALGSRYMQFIPVVESHKGELQPFSVPPQGYGQFLVDVFHEWLPDRGQIFVIEFDNLLGQWLGYPSNNCVFRPTCGSSLVVEACGDVYSCDHFVYPDYHIGNLNQQQLAEIVSSAAQRQFGQNKQAKLSQACLNCKFRILCHGGCPKHRIVPQANSENHNYLCPSYQQFFAETSSVMRQMSEQIRFAGK